MKWWEPAYLAKYGAPSRRQIDVNDPSTYASVPGSEPASGGYFPNGESKASAQPTALSFDPAKHESPMALQSAEVLNAARMAAGLAMRRLGLKSLRVRYFEGSAAPRIMGATKGSDEATVWIRAGLSAEETALTVAHEASHSRDEQGITELRSAGRHSETLCVDAISERRAQMIEEKLAPLIRAKLRQFRADGPPWAGFRRTGEVRV